MEWIAILDFIKLVGAAVGGIFSIISLGALIMKKPRKWLSNLIKESTGEKLDEINKDIKEIHQTLEDSKETDISLLRHDITALYHKYKDDKKIPVHAKQDWLSMYERYEKLGGNSYVKNITRTMNSEWEEI